MVEDFESSASTDSATRAVDDRPRNLAYRLWPLNVADNKALFGLRYMSWRAACTAPDS